MAKKLKIYERFLLGIALSIDVVADIYRAGVDARINRHYYNWGPPAYKPANCYRTFSRLLTTGYIEKVVKNGQPYLRLTNKGKVKIKRDFNFFRLQNKKWDGKWRLVIFDIQEKSRYIRDSLRVKLKELGFGKLQQSIYISPHDFTQDMYEFLKSHNLLGKVFVLTAKHELMGDAKDLAWKVWQLGNLKEEYEAILRKIKDIKEEKPKDKNYISKIKDLYLDLIQKDPCLPGELLPSDWLTEKIRKEIILL